MMRATMMLLAAMLLAGCGKKDADQSSPKAAAAAWFDAIQRGDATAARKCAAVKTDQDGKYVDALAAMEAAFAKLREAATARFGEAGRKLASGDAGGDMLEKIKDAAEKIEGDKATLTVKGGHRPLGLVKIGGDWKVEMTSIGQRIDAKRIEMLTALAAAADQVSDHLAQGRHSTVQEAQRALTERVLGSTPPATKGSQ